MPRHAAQHEEIGVACAGRPNEAILYGEGPRSIAVIAKKIGPLTVLLARPVSVWLPEKTSEGSTRETHRTRRPKPSEWFASPTSVRVRLRM